MSGPLVSSSCASGSSAGLARRHLNNRIVERLRLLSQMRAHGNMLHFKIGYRVSFQPEGRPILVGMLTRYNRGPLP